MKICVAIVLAFVTLASANDPYGSGQPGCKTEAELIIKFFKNNWNPSQYWACEELGKPGVVAYCPIGTGYQNRLYMCIDWQYWRWEKPQIPISSPDPQ